MKLNKPASPSFKRNLRGMVFGNGSLLALDAPPRLNNGRGEWLCQCQIHDVEPKYFRITKLENGEINLVVATAAEGSFQKAIMI